MSLKIEEVFESVQGEGALSGTGAQFIRLRGCNAIKEGLECAEWCDTLYSWATPAEAPINWTSDRLEEEILNSKMPLTVFTGGEPLLQKADLIYWIERTHQIQENYPKIIAVETNGTIKRSVPKASKMWWTVSPKPPKYHLEYGPISEIKIVIPKSDPEEWYFNNGYRFQEWLNICPRVFIQPQDNDFGVADWMVNVLIPKQPYIRVNLQLHKILGVK